jgi:hypothetical protein
MADRLTQKQFDILARRAFEPVLRSHGFSCERSNHCTFYRRMPGDIYHFIVPDPLRRLPKYDVKVFAHSPRLEAAWDAKFPDALGIPTGSLSALHSRTGVGPNQELFFCRTEEGFIRDFEVRVRPALGIFALPYLDRLKSLADLRRLKLNPAIAEQIDAILRA